MSVFTLTWEDAPLKLSVFDPRDERVALKTSQAGRVMDRAGIAEVGALLRDDPGRREALILGGAGLAAAAAGAVVGAFTLQSRSGAADLLGARFPDLAGRPRRLLDWKGRALLCNFWATWCAPCREEIPLLDAAKQNTPATRVELVGIAIDSADKIREFSETTQSAIRCWWPTPGRST